MGHLKGKKLNQRKQKRCKKVLGNFFYSGIILCQNISIKLMGISGRQVYCKHN